MHMPLTFKRWVDLLLLTLIAVLICILIHPLIRFGANIFTELLFFWPTWIQYLIVGLLTGFVWVILIRLGGFRFSHLIPLTFLRYPPAWFFGLIGASVYTYLVTIFFSNNFYHVISLDIRICVSSMFLGVTIISFIDLYFARHEHQKSKYINQQIKSTEGSNNILSNTDDLIRWIQEEVPIEHPSQDLFNLSIMAKKIVKILIAAKLKTVGIVGSYGSGKSSLLNLIEYYVNNSDEMKNISNSNNIEGNSANSLFDGKILVCRVDGWGRNKGSIAQQILTIAVKRLSHEADCLSVITVPANYREALSGSKSSIGTVIAALLNSEENPIITLERINIILQAVRMRLIILLEDLDINYSDAMIRDEMPALLDRMHDLENMSFVFAIGTEHQYSRILIRICEHLESLA